MAAVALILFNQGGPGTAGEAFEGSLAGVVTITNNVNTDVASWRITMCDVPPGSAVATGVLATGNNNTPTANFTPDVAGSFRVMLEVFESVGLTGTKNTDIRNFGIRNARGIIIPPFQKLPDPLPLVGSNQPGEKPDEQNYGGQLRGWAGNRADGQLEEFFLTYDDPKFRSVTTTPFNSTVLMEPAFVVNLTTIGGNAVFNLPTTGLRTGQRFRVFAFGGAVSNTVTVNPPGGHTINGLSSVAMFSGGSGVFVYTGGTTWVMLGAKRDRYERSIVASLESTEQTGFTAIGSTVIDLADFVNVSLVTWQAIIETTNAADAAEIRLFNVTTSTTVASSTLNTVSLSPVLVSANVTLAAGANLYEAQLRLTTTGTPNRATCKQAQLIVSWLQP
jgi:hypothetical protein